MAKYIGSPWGYISGKLGDAIGSKTKGGVKTVRAYRKGKSLGSFFWLAHNKHHPKAIRQANIKHVVFPILLSIARQKSRDLILPIWKPLTKYKPKLTHFNLFVKANFPRLYRSIPNPFEFCSIQNSPDLKKIILSYGLLEDAPILNCYLHKDKIFIKWNPTCLRNGNPDDSAYLMAIQYHPPIGTQKNQPLCKIWGDALNPVAKRKDGEATLLLHEKHKTHHQLQLFNNYPDEIGISAVPPLPLIVYLFFSNPKIGFSISNSYSLK